MQHAPCSPQPVISRVLRYRKMRAKLAHRESLARRKHSTHGSVPREARGMPKRSSTVADTSRESRSSRLVWMSPIHQMVRFLLKTICFPCRHCHWEGPEVVKDPDNRHPVHKRGGRKSLPWPSVSSGIDFRLSRAVLYERKTSNLLTQALNGMTRLINSVTSSLGHHS